MSNNSFAVPASWARQALIDVEKYKRFYQASIEDSDSYWRDMGKRIDWIKPYTKVKNTTYEENKVAIKWFEDGSLNAAVNCIDRHLPHNKDRVAIIWEGDEPHQHKNITYQELHDHVCRFANVLKAQGVKRGDRVTIYMPMIPEAAFAMLACARIGAVHSVVFGGFSPEALAGRISDCHSTFVITANEGIRGNKTIPLKANVDEALKIVASSTASGGGAEGGGSAAIKSVICVRYRSTEVNMVANRDVWLHEEIAKVKPVCPAEEMNAEDPLFILYTSGSTGKPKGVLHTTGGYMVYASMTHEYVFDYRNEDIYWCTADVGWVTGHSYIIYGPLANGATTLMFEGVPNYPDSSRFWQICDKHKVTIFYTAPTALRALIRDGDDFVKKSSRKTLRLLGSVGEPINPEAWLWYYNVVGEGRCPIVDTWWQTETGGILISPLAGAHALKPGSAAMPFFGISPVLLDDKGKELNGEAQGNLCLKDSWPGQMRTMFGDHQRFMDTYFKAFPNYYFTGDGARRDKDGYYWITGRVDDVLNVSGHRLGTAEIESALVAHKDVAESAVVGYPHDIKGQGIYAYVTLKADINADNDLDERIKELKLSVRRAIGAIATPDIIQFTPALPKTRSGKIMRRILRKIAENEFDSLGDISTLADSTVVKELIKNKPQENKN